jgi:hypothetical protein
MNDHIYLVYVPQLNPVIQIYCACKTEQEAKMVAEKLTKDLIPEPRACSPVAAIEKVLVYDPETWK